MKLNLYFALAAFLIPSFSFAACPTTSIAVKDATGASQTLCYAGASGSFLNQTTLTDSSNAAISSTNGLYTNILQGNAVLALANPLFITGTGTAGSAAVNPITVQGITSMTPLLTNPGTAANWGIQSIGSTTSGQSGILAMAASTTTPPSETTAQTNMLSQDLNGNLRVAPISACNKVINISQTTTTDVHTFTGFGYICGGVLVASAAMNVGIDEGTGTTCESSGTALIGVSSTASATATVALAANGGFIIPTFRTQTSADHLCVISGTGTVAGTITYADLTN